MSEDKITQCGIMSSQLCHIVLEKQESKKDVDIARHVVYLADILYRLEAA